MIPVDDVPCMCAFHVWFDFESCCFKSLTPSPLIDGEVVYLCIRHRRLKPIDTTVPMLLGLKASWD